MPRQRQRWGKLHQLALPGDELRSELLGLSGRAGDALSESRATFPVNFAATWGKLGAMGQRRGPSGRRRGGSRPASPADLPEHLLMQPSPSPSQVWKRRRILSSSPVLDVSLLLLPPLALPRRRRHHAPAPGSGGGGRARPRRNPPARTALAAPGPSLTDDGACPVVAAALRARDSTAPGFVRVGKMGALQSPEQVTQGRGREGERWLWR